MRVFIVEDSPHLIDRLKCVVEVKGGKVVDSSDTETGALMGMQIFRPDMLIVDLCITQGSGIRIIEKARVLYPEMYILVYTNLVEGDCEEVCRKAGADIFLDKNRHYLELVSIIEALTEIYKFNMLAS